MVIMQILQRAAHTSILARPIAIPGQIQTMLTHLMEQQSTTSQQLRIMTHYSQRLLDKDKEVSQESKKNSC